jgi:hypothetical protein
MARAWSCPGPCNGCASTGARITARHSAPYFALFGLRWNVLDVRCRPRRLRPGRAAQGAHRPAFRRAVETCGTTSDARSWRTDSSSCARRASSARRHGVARMRAGIRLFAAPAIACGEGGIRNRGGVLAHARFVGASTRGWPARSRARAPIAALSNPKAPSSAARCSHRARLRRATRPGSPRGR